MVLQEQRTPFVRCIRVAEGMFSDERIAIIPTTYIDQKETELLVDKNSLVGGLLRISSAVNSGTHTTIETRNEGLFKIHCVPNQAVVYR